MRGTSRFDISGRGPASRSSRNLVKVPTKRKASAAPRARSSRMTTKLATLAVAAVLMWGLKRYSADAPVDQLRWILAPTARVVTLATGVPFEHERGEGYVSRERRFAIEKVCAGIN